MSEFKNYNPERQRNFDTTEAMKKLIDMHGSVEAALFHLEHQVPGLQKELTELQDRELKNMNQDDLDRMDYLEKLVPELSHLLEILRQSVPASKRLSPDLNSQIQDLGETIH